MEQEKKVAGPIAPPTYRQTLFKKDEENKSLAERDKQESHPLFVKKSVDLKKEDGKDEEYEDIKTNTAKKVGGSKGLFIHFESRC